MVSKLQTVKKIKSRDLLSFYTLKMHFPAFFVFVIRFNENKEINKISNLNYFTFKFITYL